jgi:hypothetical protein
MVDECSIIVRIVRDGIFPFGGGIFGGIFSLTEMRWHGISGE